MQSYDPFLTLKELTVVGKKQTIYHLPLIGGNHLYYNDLTGVMKEHSQSRQVLYNVHNRKNYNFYMHVSCHRVLSTP